MKIGTLLTAAIVSLSAVGGGLAAYVAVTKFQTMDKVSVAQSRLEIVRAVGDIPRYINPERGFATNILFGPPAVDPKQLAELNDKYRKQTDGARDKMNQVRSTLPGALDDGAAVGSAIDALNTKFASLRETIDKAIAGPADARRDAAKKIVADNAVFNNGVTALLDEQVRKIAGRFFDARKSAVGMARLLGPALLLRYLVRRLRIAHVEQRAASVFGVRAAAIRDSGPGLSYDVDTLADYRYACAHR